MSAHNYTTDAYLKDRISQDGTVPIKVLNGFPRLAQFKFTDDELADIVTKKVDYLEIVDRRENIVSNIIVYLHL